MLAQGLVSQTIAKKTGLSVKYIRAIILKLHKITHLRIPDKEVAERFKREHVKCTQQEGCKCVLCEARRWKWKVKKINEFGSTGRGPASHDGRVVRQQIGRV